MSWDIIGKHICVIEGDQVGHLNAIDVYKSLSNNNYIAFWKSSTGNKKLFFRHLFF